MRNIDFSRIISITIVATLCSAFSFFTAETANAATVSFVINDVTYTGDDSDVAAGVTITDYSGAGGSLVIPAAVNDGPSTYAVTGIGPDAFKTKGITGVTLPASLASIGPAAFQGNSISTITIPNSVTTIGNYAFFGNGLTTVDLPASLASIGNNAFGDNNLTSVTLPSALTQINAYAFQENQLTGINIPASVSIIYVGAFRGNNLTSVTIPAGVTLIGDNAFGENSGLTSITMVGDAPSITSAGVTGSFGTGEGLTIHCPAEFSISYQSPWNGYKTDAIPPSSNEESLAETGIDARGGVLGAIVLSGLGIGFSMIRSRRSRSHQ